MDYGMTQGLADCMRRRGCKLTILPAGTPAEEVLGGGTIE